ncbi:hypothetical protein ABZ208_13855 [Streptomyces sp. NPDC006208]|uniref:hypothetical protein n=1 Tax=Streptomyces sp. NPDC006208 TaxID=3156734 RepID=UPI00339F75BC
MYLDDLPIVSPPEDPLDYEIWDLLEKGGGERLPLLTANELKAAMRLLQVLALGDGLGHEQALALAGRISRRLPDDE